MTKSVKQLCDEAGVQWGVGKTAAQLIEFRKRMRERVDISIINNT